MEENQQRQEEVRLMLEREMKMERDEEKKKYEKRKKNWKRKLEMEKEDLRNPLTEKEIDDALSDFQSDFQYQTILHMVCVDENEELDDIRNDGRQDDVRNETEHEPPNLGLDFPTEKEIDDVENARKIKVNSK